MEMTSHEVNQYDHILIAFSGGKDSLATLLHLIDLGVDLSKVELWHHDIDGREGSTLMDWECTRDYCRKVAEAFNIPIYYSWKVGGFEREMLREDAYTAPVRFETPGGKVQETKTVKNPKFLNTRRMFPQTAASLSVRWCSSYLKIMVCQAAINNQERFQGKKTLVVTGERAEESASRANYKEFEPHKSDNREGKKVQRHVDHWRPVHSWSEEQVWEIIERYKVNPHPAYRLGWGRVSCATCIFGSANQWASIREINREKFEKIAGYEDAFGKTIHRKLSVRDQADKGKPYETMSQEDIKAALSHEFNEPIILENWKLPAGAYGESCGPI